MNEDDSIFSSIFRDRKWGGEESVSGPGSDLINTKRVLRELPELLHRLSIESLIDAPCGDMNWMRHLNYRWRSFLGVDIVPEIIAALRAQAWPVEFHFQVGNLVKDILPCADAVLCRDCLVHLPFSSIENAVRLFRRAGFRFLITTTFSRRQTNHDGVAGDWRPLNMALGPFFWGEPLLLLPEREPGDGYEFPDKSLGVWSLGMLNARRSAS
jgi:hypothetical protein